MKRILIFALLLLIALLFLYAAYLDGVAFAEDGCKFCNFIETHSIEDDAQLFPQNVVGSMKSIDYELVLYDHLIHGHDRVARHPIKYNISLSYCPECGRQLK